MEKSRYLDMVSSNRQLRIIIIPAEAFEDTEQLPRKHIKARLIIVWVIAVKLRVPINLLTPGEDDNIST